MTIYTEGLCDIDTCKDKKSNILAFSMVAQRERERQTDRERERENI